MKTFIAVMALLALVAGGWYWKSLQPVPTVYETAPVSRGTLVQAVTATGSLNAVTSVTVGCQISGNISHLYADFNSEVEANQKVAEIDPSLYNALLHQAQGNVANAKAALELAQITAKRKQELVAEHAAAQADLDTAVAALHQAEAQVQIQEANQENAQVNVNNCTIYSPIKGIVISRSVDVGQTVAAAMNAPTLFTIANDLTKMQIDSSVAEADVGQVVNNQAVNFTVDAYPYRTFHGQVEQVRNAPNVVQNVVTYDVVVSVNNADLKLKPGMTANMGIVIATSSNALRIPNSALRYRPPDLAKSTPSAGPHSSPGAGGHQRYSASAPKTVYVMPAGSNTPQPVSVHLGISDGIYTEVKDGLKEDDTVVTGVESIAKSGAGGGGPPGFGGQRRPF